MACASSGVPPRFPTTSLAKGRPHIPRQRGREAPSPSGPSLTPQRHPFPTGSTRRHRGLRRHADRRPTRPERHPVPLYGSGGRRPLRNDQPPRPGRRARANQTFARSSCLPGKTSDRTGDLASEGREARRNSSRPGGPFVCFSCHHPSRTGALAQAFRRASQIVFPFPRALACRLKDWQRIGSSGTIKRRGFEFFC